VRISGAAAMTGPPGTAKDSSVLVEANNATAAREPTVDIDPA
jgi:hypothetical protein